MRTPEQERLDAISEALARLIKRQDDLEARFRQIEAMAGFKTAAPPPAAEPIAPPVAAMPPRPPPLPPPGPPPAAVQQPPPPPPPEPAHETQLGLNWINHIAVITLILGTAFFFKYAVDNNWIGPGARIALGVVAAMISLFFGDLLWKREQKVFAQGLTGLGLALLYLSFYATFGLYHVLPQAAAFVLMVLTTASAAVFALRYESQAIAIIGLLGGYLTPVTLSTGEDHPWVLFSYTVLLNLGALALARLRLWRAIEYIALAATVVLYAGWSLSWLDDKNHLVATVFSIAFYSQFAASGSRIVWLFAQLLASVAAPAIWKAPADFLPLALLFAAGGIAAAELRGWSEAPPWTLFCFWLAYWIGTASASRIDQRGTIFLLLSIAFFLFFAWTIWWAEARKRALRSTDLFVLAANAATYFGASYFLLNPIYHDYMGLFAVVLAAPHLAIAKILWKPESTDEQERWPAMLAVAVTLTFLTLAIPIQFTGFRITIAWALEGAVLAWLASRFASTRLNVATGFVLVLVFLRLFAFDFWIYANGNQFAGIANLRFLTFVVSAASMWIAARFLAPRIAAAAPYVAGHFVMLWILGAEVVGWVERSFAPNEQWSVITVGVSILMALYALMLVSVGVVTRTALNRILGLGLMGIVVAKLYLSDVWQLGRVFRITAFLGLGVLLLLVSYLYSRFRPVIERLWRDDTAA